MNKERFDFLIYRNGEENISVNAVVHDESIWLTQKAMSELFGVEIPAVSKHLKNIYDEGELERAATSSTGRNPVCEKIGRVLQPGCHYFCRLSCQFQKSHCLPHLGNKCS